MIIRGGGTGWCSKAGSTLYISQRGAGPTTLRPQEDEEGQHSSGPQFAVPPDLACVVVSSSARLYALAGDPSAR